MGCGECCGCVCVYVCVSVCLCVYVCVCVLYVYVFQREYVMSVVRLYRHKFLL